MQNMSHEKSKPSNVVHGTTTVPGGLTPAAIPEPHLQRGQSVLACSMIHGSFSSTQRLMDAAPGDESMNASRCHASLSSVVLSSGGSFGKDKIIPKNVCQSSLLKERDYVGLAEISSASLQIELSDKPETSSQVRSRGFDLDLEETDLRLGLGPPEFFQYCSPAEHTLSSNVVKGSKTATCTKQSVSGLGGAPVLVSEGHAAVAQDASSAATQGYAPHFCMVAECSTPYTAHIDTGKEQAWSERPPVVNQNPLLGRQKFKDNWVKSDTEREQVSSDSWALQDSQSFQQGTWAGSDIMHPNVNNIYGNASDKRPSVVPEIATSHLWQSQILQNADPSRLHFQSAQAHGLEYGAARSATFSGYAGTRVLSTARNGVKRGYFEAMVGARHNTVDCGPGMHGTGSSAAGGKNTLQLPEEHVPRYSNPHLSSFTCNWAAVKPLALASWQTGFDQSGSFKPFASSVPNKSANGIASHTEVTADATGISWGPCSKSRDGYPTLDKAISDPSQSQSVLVESKHSRSDHPPLQKDQVVGWPPVRSFRKNTIASHAKPVCDKEGGDRCPAAVAGNNECLLYVKVNMDGVFIGRKVDLNTCNSYGGLLHVLEEMFQHSRGGQTASQTTPGRESNCCDDSKQPKLFTNSDYVLTYEDKDGDCMLVGDVPWDMFVSTVRRLRIMKGSEATGLAPRRADKTKCPP